MELNLIVNLAAAAVFGAIAAYILVLTVRQAHGRSMMARLAKSEQQLLDLRISDLIERSRLERMREELSWGGWRKFEIAQRVDEGGDVCSFVLAPHDKRLLPPFMPGQYLTFQLKLPGQTKPAVRCYSLSDAPATEGYRISVKRQVPPRDETKADVTKSSSNWLHSTVREGDILDVKAPSGHFFLDPSQHQPVVLIGGGVGITPVLSMLNTLVARDSEQEIWFFYGVRNGREHIMKEHLERIANEHLNVRMHVCYSDPEETDREGKDFQHKGRVGVDLFKKLVPSNNYDFLFCGPPPMMTSLYEGLHEWGVPDKHIHFEAFGPASVRRVGQATQSQADPSVAPKNFEIVFARSGKTVAWSGEFDSLLDLAEANGIPMESGCRAGNCGTCVAAVKFGDVSYAITPGYPRESGTCLTCCSVPKSNLTIDA